MATKKTTKKSADRAEAGVATKQTKKARAKPTKAKAEASTKRSALDAAARVLGETKQAMTCQEMIDAMAAKGYWTSPGGKTPANTLSAAIRREISVKGKDARFTLSERGKFALNGVK
jgi:hypothetical protein